MHSLRVAANFTSPPASSPLSCCKNFSEMWSVKNVFRMHWSALHGRPPGSGSAYRLTTKLEEQQSGLKKNVHHFVIFSWFTEICHNMCERFIGNLFEIFFFFNTIAQQILSVWPPLNICLNVHKFMNCDIQMMHKVQYSKVLLHMYIRTV